MTGDYQGSVEPLRKLMEERPDDPEVNYRYGTALLATGETGLAVWSLKKAMDSPEYLEKAGLPLAATLLSSATYDDAIEVCDRINLLRHGRIDFDRTVGGTAGTSVHELTELVVADYRRGPAANGAGGAA